MASFVTLGGSANLIADLSIDNNFVLTGLDANGKVLSTINVQVVDELGNNDPVFIILPESVSLNFRNITFNINRGDFSGTLAVAPQGEDKICGNYQPVKLVVNKGATQQIQLLQGNNWTISATLLG